jgi:acyl-CoA thioester hydrolase
VTCAAHNSEVEFRVRYAETDQMSRAYYGAYFAWFEVGRVEFLRDLGSSYAELEREGCLLPVVEAQARYLSPAHYDEELLVRTTVVSSGPIRVEFSSEIFSKADERKIAEGRVVLACMSADGKPRRLPADLRTKIKAVISAGVSTPGERGSL